MAEKLLKVKGVFDPGDVQTGLQALTANMRDMGKAALEVGGSKDAWASLGTAIEKMRPDLANVATVAYETAKAMDGIGRSGANFTQIEAGVSKATGYLKILKDAMQEAEKAGVDIGPKVKASIETMEQGIAGAAAKAKVLRESFQGAVPPETAKNVDALSRALDNLEKAADSPKRLGTAAAIAKFELDDMRDAAEKAGNVTKEMGARFDEAESKIKAAAERAGRFRDTAGDLATQGNLSAKSFESIASAAGSAEGMLGRLKDTGGPVAGKLADIGFAGIALGAAFTAGYEGGKKLEGWLKPMGVDLGKFRNEVEKTAMEFLIFNGIVKDHLNPSAAFSQAQLEKARATERAMKEVERAKGVVEGYTGTVVKSGQTELDSLEKVGKGFETLLKKQEGLQQGDAFIAANKDEILKLAQGYANLGVSLDQLSPKEQDMIKRAMAAAAAAADAAGVLADAQKVAETFGNKTEHEVLRVGESTKVMRDVVYDNSGQVQQALVNMAAKFDGLGITAKKAEPQIGDYAMSLTNVGREADDARERLDALDIQMGKTGKKGEVSEMGGSLNENIDAVNKEQEAIGKLMDARTRLHEMRMRHIEAEARANKQAEEDHQRKMTQAQEEIDAAGQLTQYEEGSIKFKGQLKIINMQLAEATEAVTKSLLDQVKAFDELNKKQEEHNSLMDYAANLLNAYQTGYTDLITSMNRVSETLQQLRAILMHNIGTPFEAKIREWIKAFEDLQKTIAEGGKGPGPMKVF